MTEVEIFKQSLDVSRIAMYITILVTIVTVTFSALSLAFQRSHNIKSVKPLCNLKIAATKNGIKIILANAGLGPMIIQRILVAEEDGRERDFKEFMAGILSDKENAIASISGKENRILPMSEEEVLFEIEKPSAGKIDLGKSLKEKLNGKSLCVTYCDIYDRRYTMEESL